MDADGQDMDIWGGADTTLMLIPRPGGSCVLSDDENICPAGCRQCLDFAEEMEIINHKSEGIRS